MARVAILLEDLYEELELWYPYHRLREAGHEPVLVAPELRAYRGKAGSYPATADLAIADADPDEFDGLVVPGGYAPDKLRRISLVLDFVRTIDAAGKPIAAICHAGWVLISANILRGRHLTSVGAIRDDLVNAGALWEDAPLIVDGNLVTSRTPADLPEFGKALVRMFARAD